MHKKTLIFLGLAAVIGLSACEKPAEEPGEPEAAPPTEDKSTMDELREKGEGLKEAAKEAAEGAMAAAEEKGAETMQAAAEMAESAERAAGEMASEMMAQAEEWIAEAEAYIKEGKDEMAAAVVEKLQGIKASLPESMQDEIDALSAMLGGGEGTAAVGESAAEPVEMPPSEPAQQ